MNDATSANNVYMKCFAYGLTIKIVTNSRQHITAYENWLQASHASYTLDRYVKADKYE